MRRGLSFFAAGAMALALLAGLGLAACGGGAEDEPVVVHDPEEWAWLQETKQSLDAGRQELRDLKSRLEAKADEGAQDAADAADAAEGAATEAEMTAEKLEARIQELRAELATKTEEFTGRLVEFINNGIRNDAEETEIHQQAIRMKSDEDLLLGEEYIDKGADYQRAIEIYQNALLFDPEYQPLKDAIARAESDRYMSEERFAQVKKKMSQKEVRKLLGVVKGANVREFPERFTVGWFYRKADGGAAGIYFRENNRGAGDWEVYLADFDAVKSPTAGGEDEGDEIEG